MDDKEWRTFVTVVDEGNITKAAEKLSTASFRG